MKAECQTGLEEQCLPWGKRQVMFVRKQGDGQLGRLCHHSSPTNSRARFNLWHCLSWAVSLSSSLLSSISPLFFCSPSFPGFWCSVLLLPLPQRILAVACSTSLAGSSGIPGTWGWSAVAQVLLSISSVQNPGSER